MDIFKYYSQNMKSLMNISDEEYSDLLVNFAKEADEQRTRGVTFKIIAQKKKT